MDFNRKGCIILLFMILIIITSCSGNKSTGDKHKKKINKDLQGAVKRSIKKDNSRGMKNKKKTISLKKSLVIEKKYTCKESNEVNVKIKKVEELLKNNPSCIDVKGEEGKIALVIATYNGETELVSNLIARGVKPDFLTDIPSRKPVNTKLTPLHLTSKLEIVKLLVENGADINKCDGCGQTPLHIYTGGRSLDFLGEIKKENSVKLLSYAIKKGAEINVLDEYNFSPLHRAVETGNLDVVKVLVENGADVNISSQGKGRGTPIMWIAKIEGNPDIARYLIDKGADLKVKNTYNENLLHLSSGTSKDKLDMIRLFIKGNVDINARDNEGRTPLHCAVLRDNKEVIATLLSAGADPNAKDNNGKTPFSMAVGKTKEKMDEVLRNLGH